jgi:hypothetical protein
MAIEENRARMTDRIWQAMAQSGVDLHALPQERQAVLVAAIANGVLLEVNAMLSEISKAEAAASARAGTDSDQNPVAATQQAGEETVLWEGRPFLSLTESYAVTSERVRISTGLLGKAREDIELVRLKDIDQKQNLAERITNLGDIYLRSADLSKPMVILRDVTDPDKVHEIIRRAMLDARVRHNVRIQQEF